MTLLKFTGGSDDDDDKHKQSKTNRLNRRGVVLTLILVISVVAASFLVWTLPNGNNAGPTKSNMTVTFLNPNMTLSSVKSQFDLLKKEVDDQVKGLNTIETQNASSTRSFLSASISQNEELMKTLLNGNPDQTLLPAYLAQMSKMKNYSIFLNNLINNKTSD